MTESQFEKSRLGRIRFLFIALLPLLLLLILVQSIIAQDTNEPQGITAAQLNASKVSDVTQALPGETVQYTISITNIGDADATGTIFTDTLPTEFDYVDGTVSIIGSASTPTVINNVVMWTGTINGGSADVQISFDAILTETAIIGDIITNTAEITGTGELLTPAAAIEVMPEIISYTTFMPVFMKSLDPIELLSAEMPTSNDGYQSYNILVTWEDLNNPDVEYVLMESRDPSFTNVREYTVSTPFFRVTHPATAEDTRFYYRVRYTLNGLTSSESNTLLQNGAYYDNFEDDTSGWALRRQDTDDTNDWTYYDEGIFKMKIGGRWDSIIAGPMVLTPDSWNGYQIETTVKLSDGIDNLHSYGIVFGADWDGVSPCPDETFLTCFNSYYRLNVVWSGSTSKLKVQLKRVDSHDPSNNTDEGEEIMGFREISVSDPNSWNTWKIQVFKDGTINLFAGNNLFYTGNDTRYVSGNRYFGTFASSNEYSGTAAWWEEYKVTPRP